MSSIWACRRFAFPNGDEQVMTPGEMMRKAVSLVFAVVLVLAQSLAAVAHCGPHSTATGHAQHENGAGTHDHAHGSDHGTHEHGLGHGYVSQDASSPDGDLGASFGDCTLGSVGVETVGAAIPGPHSSKGFQVEIRENTLSAVTISLPTPPPNTRL